MSRLIVRNLPKTLEAEKLVELFSSHGEVTDARICRKSSGESRRFGFIGFKDDVSASEALTYFNKSYIGTSKINVDFAKDIGDQTVPRPWSKYSSQSSAFQRNSKESNARKERIRLMQEKLPANSEGKSNANKKDKNKNSIEVAEKEDEREELELNEFINAHQKPSQKKIWTNETVGLDTDKYSKSKENKEKTKKSKKTMGLTKEMDDAEDDNSISRESTSDGESKDNGTVSLEKESVVSNRDKKSDLDWLQSKISKRVQDSTEDDVNDEKEGEEEEEDGDKSSSESDGDSESDSEDDSDDDHDDDQLDMTIKMRGIPFSCTEKQIIAFFTPLKILDIRMPLDEKGRKKGYAYVDFESESDVNKALKRNNGKMKTRYVELFQMKKQEENAKRTNRQWTQKVAAPNEEEEPVAESGRLFLRNLSYSCTEDDIRGLFEKYGPIAEVHLPIDKATKRITGIGFVTFVMPEHAVLAFNEVDGKVFQGRLLHVIPARGKRVTEDQGTDREGAPSSYKKERTAKLKSLSSSGHNWNTLFLGQNAIVDTLAQRLNVEKSKILEAENTDSLAVRMALGETQLVAETREFLISHGVKIDSFGQISSKRSSEVILVKNLPHGTKDIELRNLFGKFGDLDKVLLPPSGITAIVQFSQPTEARTAFRGLAYSKFKHVPLYLEWAPADVFCGVQPQAKEKDTAEDVDNKDEDNDADDGTTENSGRIVFVKNLNFDTKEEEIEKHFQQCGKIKSVTIARKKDPKKPQGLLSMGYGFVQYKHKTGADEAIKTLQHSMLDDHQLELKKSHRKEENAETSRKRTLAKKQTTSKILVRNVPFEASRKEIKQLFGTFGELKTVRIPKKVAGTGSHRGFAFVDFVSKQDAKRAFQSLCQSTHLYGRRLVLEWAEDDETVDSIRNKTALHFGEEPMKKKTKKQDIIETLEDSHNEPAL